MAKLAIFGGNAVLKEGLPPYNSIGREEHKAVDRVMRSGKLSGFIGAWGESFWGGSEVRSFEKSWTEMFGVQHAVSMNSATSALYAAVGATGVEPGDEVIVPPLTMSATVMAPLLYGGIPVFVDVEPDTFCLDLAKVKANITSRTKAILAVNLFGHPAPLLKLRKLADEHGIKLIEDNAQGLLAQENQNYAGTIGHIGIFSLNFHKHIHTGEGGVCVTDDNELALRLQMIRNHGENAVEAVSLSDISNMIGFNYRLTELCAAIGFEQLRKAKHEVDKREAQAKQLTAGISKLEGLIPPSVQAGCRHVYYCWVVRFDKTKLGITRQAFSKALAAEGFPHSTGYVRPLYLLPLFQRRIAIGSKGYPFLLTDRSYEKGICPVAELLHEEELLLFHLCSYELDVALIDKLLEAVHKVYAAREQLKALDSERDIEKTSILCNTYNR